MTDRPLVGRVQFPTAYAKYRLFNFQDTAALSLVSTHLFSTDPGAVLLSAEAGLGRRYLVDAAAHEARQAGHHLEVVEIDLTGYDGDAANLLAFAGSQLRRASERAPGQPQTIPTAA